MVETYGNQNLGKKFEDNIYKPMKQAYMDLVQIISSIKFNWNNKKISQKKFVYFLFFIFSYIFYSK